MTDIHATRRGTLGTRSAPPVTALPAISTIASTSEWEGNLAAYRKADASVSAFEREHLIGKDIDDATQDRFDDLVMKEVEAFDVMFRTPSPHLSAFIEKLRVCVDDDMAGIPGAERMAAELLEDLRCLTTQGEL
jgi:hypothetical protein